MGKNLNKKLFSGIFSSLSFLNLKNKILILILSIFFGKFFKLFFWTFQIYYFKNTTTLFWGTSWQVSNPINRVDGRVELTRKKHRGLKKKKKKKYKTQLNFGQS